MVKIIFSILSVLFGLFCFVPYIRDIFKGTTKPHMYSWIVWMLLQGTAAIIMFQGGAELGVLSLSIGAVLCGYIVFLSIKHGTKHIDFIDTVCLLGALVSIIVWIFLDSPLVSVILISVIDFVGFIPTFRKSFKEPETETAITYLLSAISGLFAIIAVTQYSFVTVIYLVSLIITNGLCATIIYSRKKTIYDSTISKI